jgi:hypothetical protein
MESENWIPSSQDFATGLYPEPHEPSWHPLTLLLSHWFLLTVTCDVTLLSGGQGAQNENYTPTVPFLPPLQHLLSLRMNIILLFIHSNTYRSFGNSAFRNRLAFHFPQFTISLTSNFPQKLQHFFCSHCCVPVKRTITDYSLTLRNV